jgi:hypothetical protein
MDRMRKQFPSLSKLRFRVSGPKRMRPIAWGVTSIAVLVLGSAIVAPLWLPGTIRALIPDRYIAAYAPEPLQDLIFERQNPSSILPTVASNEHLVSDLLATSTPVPNPATATPTPTSEPLPEEYYLSGLTHIYQGWNNCGPATFATTLSYWGVQAEQRDVANFVKPNPEDRNVRPDELASFVETRGLHAVVRINGTLDLLKRFVSSGFPVVIEQGFEVEEHGWMGHYVVITGYSDVSQSFTTMDSYLGPNYVYPYSRIEKYWWHFSNLYIVQIRQVRSRQSLARIEMTR